MTTRRPQTLPAVRGAIDEGVVAPAGEMAEALEDILAGRMKVQCRISMTRRMGYAAMHAIDRHPLVAPVFLLGGGVKTIVTRYADLGSLQIHEGEDLVRRGARRAVARPTQAR